MFKNVARKAVMIIALAIFASKAGNAHIGQKFWDKMKEEQNNNDVAAEMISGAAIAFTYTDKEILETLGEEQAQDFINLRNSSIAEANEGKEYQIGNNDCDDISLAAEDDIQYK